MDSNAAYMYLPLFLKNPLPRYQHSVCALYRCEYTRLCRYHVTTEGVKRRVMIVIVMTSLYQQIQEIISIELEENSINIIFLRNGCLN